MRAGPVIITRAEPGNRQTASRVAAQGLAYLSAPMLVLEATDAVLPNLEPAQGLVFTSANGVRAFARASTRRDLTAWCVGPATLEAARGTGFTALRHGDGNAEDLAGLIEADASPEKGELVHVANEAAAGRLSERLRASGFAVKFAPLYRAVSATRLPDNVVEALNKAAPARVLIHSAKGAEAFIGCQPECRLERHILVAVSHAAAAPLAGSGFARTYIAERPNEDALLHALFSTYSSL